MSYDNFSNDKTCEYCDKSFATRNNRARLCPEHQSIQYEIDAVRGEKNYSDLNVERIESEAKQRNSMSSDMFKLRIEQAEELRRRVAERLDRGRTTKTGGMFGSFNPKDPDGSLGIANEYRRRWRKDI